MSQLDNPLTEADCAYCIRVLTVDAPQTEAELARAERMGLPMPQIAERNAASKQFALGILRELWPHRIPNEYTQVG